MAFLSQANALTIKILEGPLAGTDDGTISLQGASLPSAVNGRGTIAYESEQRVRTTWYAGNPVATQQLMGPVDKPTVITGAWHDVFLGNGTSALLRNTFDGLMRSGVAIEVTWGQGYFPDGQLIPGATPIVRRGIVKRFKHSYERPQDITWEIEFEWRGRDDAALPPLQSAGQGDDNFADLTESLDATSGAIEAFETDPITQLAGLNDTIQGAFDDVQSNIGQSINTLNFASDTLATTANLPNEVLERVRGTTTNLLGSLRNFEDVALAINFLDIEVRDSALATLDIIARRLTMLEEMDITREKSANIDAALAARQAPDILAEVRPTPGTDFRELARQFYGDPDLWWLIAQYNGYGNSSSIPALPTGPTDTPPLPIRVPRRTEGVQGSLSNVC